MSQRSRCFNLKLTSTRHLSPQGAECSTGETSSDFQGRVMMVRLIMHFIFLFCLQNMPGFSEISLYMLLVSVLSFFYLIFVQLYFSQGEAHSSNLVFSFLFFSLLLRHSKCSHSESVSCYFRPAHTLMVGGRKTSANHHCRITAPRSEMSSVCKKGGFFRFHNGHPAISSNETQERQVCVCVCVCVCVYIAIYIFL